jgi:hypothetical protein
MTVPDYNIGRVHPTKDQTTAECSDPTCPWTFTTDVPGKAAKELMEHNQEEHR